MRQGNSNKDRSLRTEFSALDHKEEEEGEEQGEEEEELQVDRGFVFRW
jgi:hypothetical protein